MSQNNRASLLHPWLEKRRQAKLAYRDGRYAEACEFYTAAIEAFEANEFFPLESTGRANVSLSLLYGNRAQCWKKLGEVTESLRDAKRCANLRPAWFKGHLRVARAYSLGGSLHKAVSALERAYRSLTSQDDDTIRCKILHELVETGRHLEDQIPRDLTEEVPASLWSQVTYLYIDSKFQDWKTAEFIVNKAWKIKLKTETSSVGEIQPLKYEVDLGQFCKYDQLNKNTQWVCRLLLWYLTAGCDHLQLKFHPGDTYFHATVTIVVLTAETLTMEVMSLLQHVVENIVLVNHEENIVDDKGNTVCHHLATLDSQPSAEEVLVYLLNKGVDIRKKNKDMKTALQIATKPQFVNILLKENTRNLVTEINNDYSLSKQETGVRNDDTKINDLINLISSNFLPANLPELLSLCDEAYLEILTCLALSQKWELILTLFDEKMKTEQAEKFGYHAKNISILNLIKEPKQVCHETVKIELVKRLAAVDADLTETSLLVVCLQNEEWELANTLLELGADPSGLSLEEGDTPNHAALNIALDKTPGNFSILKTLRSIYEQGVNHYPKLDLSEKDNGGNTILHVAAKSELNEHSIFAVKLLCEWNVDPCIEDADKKRPAFYLNEDDDRLICLKSLPNFVDKHTEAIKSLVTEINNINKLKKSKKKNKMDKTKLKELCTLISTDMLPAILPILLELDHELFLEMLKCLARTNNWLLFISLLKEDRKTKPNWEFDGFTKDISLLTVVKEPICAESLKIEIVKQLAELKANVTNNKLLQHCLHNEEWLLANTLLEVGVDPVGLSLEEGDSPNHAALNIGLNKTPGDFTILQTLRKLHEGNKNSYDYLHLSHKDKAGNTVLHLATRAEFSEHSVKAVKLLCEWKVEYNVKDGAGKLPGCNLTEQDERYAYLKKLPHFMSSEEAEKNESINSQNESFRKKAIDVLQKLENFRGFLTPEGNTKEYKEELQDSDEEEENDKNVEGSEDTPNEERILEDLSAYENVVVDPKDFESMEWDVDCTEEVWNLLKSTTEIQGKISGDSSDDITSKKTNRNKLSQAMKNLIMLKIKELCSGDWKSSQKNDDVPTTIQLYKTPLPMDACILWECIIAFSPRLSQTFSMKSSSSPAANGKIFSQHILIRDIVLKSSDLQAAIDKIVQSHSKGQACKVKKVLKAQIHRSRNKSGADSKHLPIKYTECDDAPKEIDGRKYVNFYPPASSHSKEHTILKFYPLNSLMAEAILRNSDSEIDFPFQVTDIEHSIIHLEQNSPILLLGRSGTGKTTCCLYRLWALYLKDRKGGQPRYLKILPAEEDLGEFIQTDDSDENESKDENEGVDEYEYLHQVFVTKNSVLCAEVRKNFKKLCRTSKITEINNQDRLLNNLQDLEDNDYPLFFTSRQLLLLLDASADGKSFFPRDEDLALKHPIAGWGMQDKNLAIMLTENVADDAENSNRQSTSSNSKAKEKKKRLRECNYDMFSTEIWSTFDKKKTRNFHPSLVWTEIMSFIKGSFESLSTEQGYLTLHQYQSVGLKQAPKYTAERNEIYEIFKLYNSYIKEYNLFDEADVVSNIYHRLKGMHYIPWTFHEIYVDETQDFTQSELALLVTLCQNPNNMFLAGDTAQSIMRGISFRFCDLKSLFFFVEKSQKRKKSRSSKIELEHLTINYRSHAGILSLASSILALLEKLFPDTIDCLEKDQGMFDGPKPLLIETCEAAELAKLLTGSQRETSHIEFGAHQAIIVANQQTKDLLPEELKNGIVLTIFESKGLEFDDILIYNFFKDSQAEKEWRVVTEFLNALADEAKQTNEGMENFDFVLLEHKDAPKGLPFDKNQHQLLETELKQLYTAVTRARVNVWIFDECAKKRDPMFHFFKSQKLVSQGQEQSHSVKGFMEASTAKDWVKRGDEFMAKKLFLEAIKCYRKAQKPNREKKAIAYSKADSASKQTNLSLKKNGFLIAGFQFAHCKFLNSAARCFQNAGENALAAMAFEKCGKFEEAYKQYLEAKSYIKACSCLEQLGRYGDAVKELCKQKLFEEAIKCHHRYNDLIKAHTENSWWRNVLLQNKPGDEYAMDKILLIQAEYYFSENKMDEVHAVIKKLEDSHEKVSFYKRKELWENAAEILRSKGETETAAHLMLRGGKFLKALEYAQDGFHKPLAAKILLLIAEQNKPEEFDHHTKKALGMFIEVNDFNGQAKATLMQGVYREDITKINAASKIFSQAKPQNNVGKFYCLTYADAPDPLLPNTDVDNFFNVLKLGFNIITTINEAHSESKQLSLMYLSLFGLELDSLTENLICYTTDNPLMGEEFREKDSTGKKKFFLISFQKAITKLEGLIIHKMEQWIVEVKKSLQTAIKKKRVCRRHLEGFKCTTSGCQHNTNPSIDEEFVLLKLFNLSLTLDFHIQSGAEKVGEQTKTKSISKLLSSSNWDSVHEFLEFVLPVRVSPRRAETDQIQKFLSEVRSMKSGLKQVERYFYTQKSTPPTPKWIIEACFFSSLLNLKFPSIKLGTDEEETLEIVSLSKDSIEKFVSDTDPVAACKAFVKLMEMKDKDSHISMPKLDLVIFWIEVHFCTLWFSIANGSKSQSSKCQFYLPKYFLANIHNLNNCLAEKQDKNSPKTLQEMVIASRIDHKIISEIQNQLINILIGNNSNGLINRVNQLCGSKPPQFLLAERVLVLALVILLNIPRNYVPGDFEQLIRIELHKVKSTQSMPKRLQFLIEGVHAAKNYHNIITTLENFFRSLDHSSRYQSPLFHCTWTGRYNTPIKINQLDPTKFKAMNFFQLDFSGYTMDDQGQNKHGHTYQGQTNHGQMNQGQSSQGHTNQTQVSQGQANRGHSHHATADQGQTYQANKGQPPQATANQGQANQGQPHHATANQGQANQGQQHHATADQGQANQGQLHHATANQGQTYQANQGQPHYATADQGQANQGQTHHATADQGQAYQSNVGQTNRAYVEQAEANLMPTYDIHEGQGNQAQGYQAQGDQAQGYQAQGYQAQGYQSATYLGPDIQDNQGQAVQGYDPFYSNQSRFINLSQYPGFDEHTDLSHLNQFYGDQDYNPFHSIQSHLNQHPGNQGHAELSHFNQHPGNQGHTDLSHFNQHPGNQGHTDLSHFNQHPGNQGNADLSHFNQHPGNQGHADLSHFNQFHGDQDYNPFLSN